jgi:hypothetical protein
LQQQSRSIDAGPPVAPALSPVCLGIGCVGHLVKCMPWGWGHDAHRTEFLCVDRGAVTFFCCSPTHTTHTTHTHTHTNFTWRCCCCRRECREREREREIDPKAIQSTTPHHDTIIQRHTQDPMDEQASARVAALEAETARQQEEISRLLKKASTYVRVCVCLCGCFMCVTMGWPSIDRFGQSDRSDPAVVGSIDRSIYIPAFCYVL